MLVLAWPACSNSRYCYCTPKAALSWTPPYALTAETLQYSRTRWSPRVPYLALRTALSTQLCAFDGYMCLRIIHDSLCRRSWVMRDLKRSPMGAERLWTGWEDIWLLRWSLPPLLFCNSDFVAEQQVRGERVNSVSEGCKGHDLFSVWGVLLQPPT